jgi:hypothetical protein
MGSIRYVKRCSVVIVRYGTEWYVTPRYFVVLSGTGMVRHGIVGKAWLHMIWRREMVW